MKAIDRFEGEYAFLSNFYQLLSHTIEMDGLKYPTVEHAYQAAKTLVMDERIFIQHLASPGQAKAQGRRVKLRPDWEEVKIGVMRDLLAKKFEAGSSLAGRLIDTGDAELIEGNWWGDRFWGCTKRPGDTEWTGLNWLGQLLMRQREALQGK